MGLFGQAIRANSSTLTSPKQWLIDFFGGGGESESGSVVNENSMLSISAVWCAVNFLASNVASLPCPVLKTDGRQRIKQKSHYLHQRLNVTANPEMTAMVWRETCIYYQSFWGTALSLIVRDGQRQVSELWPIHPDRVSRVFRKRGKLKYDITMTDGTQKTFDQDRIFRVPGLGYGVLGMSMMEHSRDSMGLMLAMRSFANLFFKNGSNMGVVFEHPTSLGEKAHANLTRSLAKAYSGLGKSHKAMVVEEGMKVQKLGVDPEKSQLLDGRKFSVTDVARWFNLPPHVLKDLSNSNYSNMQQQSLELITYSFRPWFVRLEQSYEAFLLRDFERKTMSVRHNANALMRGDEQSRGEYYRMRFGTGSITPNEIRMLEDENPIEEPWADQTYLQLNLVPTKDLAEIQADDGQQRSAEKRSVEKRSFEQIVNARDKITKRYTPLLSEALTEVISLESKALSAELEKQLEDRGKSDFSDWVNEFYDSFPGTIDKNLRSVFVSYAESMQDVVAGEIDLDPDDYGDISRETNSYLAGYSRQYISSSRGQIFQQLEEDDGLEAVRARVDEWKEKRLDKEMSETKTGIASMVARSVILGGGYALVWRTRGKSCPMCNQLNGRKITKKNQAFTDSSEDFTDKAGKTVNYRRTLYAPLHKGCDCVLTAG